MPCQPLRHARLRAAARSELPPAARPGPGAADLGPKAVAGPAAPGSQAAAAAGAARLASCAGLHTALAPPHVAAACPAAPEVPRSVQTPASRHRPCPAPTALECVLAPLPVDRRTAEYSAGTTAARLPGPTRCRWGASWRRCAGAAGQPLAESRPESRPAARLALRPVGSAGAAAAAVGC